MRYLFAWDPRKADTNWRKHGVSFQAAMQVFSDPLALSVPDQGSSVSEERWITIGQTRDSKHIVVVHTYAEIDHDQVSVRMISARVATKREIRDYEDGV